MSVVMRANNCHSTESPFYLVANWKNQGSRADVEQVIGKLSAYSELPFQLIVLLPAPLWGLWQQCTTLPKQVVLGSQYVDVGSKALTGGLSITMLQEHGCQWACIGHSERRCYTQHNQQLICDQIETLIAAGIHPIICVSTEEQLYEIRESLCFAIRSDFDIIIAYEPEWAIGAYKSPSVAWVKQRIQQLQQIIVEHYEVLPARLHWAYGGSVQPQSIHKWIDAKLGGVLVGRASLPATTFEEMIHKCCKVY